MRGKPRWTSASTNIYSHESYDVSGKLRWTSSSKNVLIFSATKRREGKASVDFRVNKYLQPRKLRREWKASVDFLVKKYSRENFDVSGKLRWTSSSQNILIFTATKRREGKASVDPLVKKYLQPRKLRREWKASVDFLVKKYSRENFDVSGKLRWTSSSQNILIFTATKRREGKASVDPLVTKYFDIYSH